MKFQEQLNKFISDKQKRKYLVILFLCGILLLLLPTSGKGTPEPVETVCETDYMIEAEEKRLEATLSVIRGAGKCRVLLSVREGAELILAEDAGETVVLSRSGTQSTVTVQKRYPDYMGAVIVSEGAGNANVRYDILSAVMSYTGLGADKITICSLEE